MSEKINPSTQKGADLFPTVGGVPIRLQVRGAEGSDQRAQIIAAHQGVLSQFIAKQRHAYSLSTIPIQQGRIDRDGVTMTYSNMHGREAVMLEVGATTKRASAGKSRKRWRWDWALIEIMLPFTVRARLEAYAQMRVPSLGTPTPDDDLPFPGVAYSPAFLAPVDRLVNAPLVDHDPGRTVLTSEYASFLVDLRSLHGTTAALVDLYAYVHVDPEFVPAPQWRWETYPEDWEFPPHDPIDQFGDFNEGGFPTGYTQETFDATRPEIAFNVTTSRWEFVDTSDTGELADSAVWKDIPSPGAPGWFITWVVYTYVGTPYDPGYLGPSPSPSEVQVTMFMGPPMIAGDYRSDNRDYARWDFTTPDGRRLGHSRVGEPLLPTFTSPRTIFRNFPFTGIVTLPIEGEGDGPVGPSFQPA